MTLTFQEFDGINRTPAIPLIARGWHELTVAGFAPLEVPISWDNQVIVALVDGDAVGVITWSHEKWKRVLWLHFGYVKPESRRGGVYRELWARLVAQARKLDAIEIHGGIHVDNSAMLATAAALGRHPLFVTTQYIIPPEPPA